MGEIKSAWEIAMEKVEKLGKLSREELSRQKEEKYGSIGQILADKCLAGLGPWQLEIELDKYNGEEKELIKSALASRLIQAIELGNSKRLERVIEVIAGLGQGKEEVEGIRGQIEQLFQEYKLVEEEESREAVKSAGEILHQLRISGTAIGAINPKAIPEGRAALGSAAGPFKDRLEGLRQELTDLSQKLPRHTGT